MATSIGGSSLKLRLDDMIEFEPLTERQRQVID